MANNDDLFSLILEDGPSSGSFYLILSRMKEEGLFEKVIQECQKALKIYPNDINIRRLLADSYLEAGQISEAEKELQTVAVKINELTTSYKSLADVYIKQGRDEDAADILKVYITHHPDDSEAAQLLGSLRPPLELPEEEPIPEQEIAAVSGETILEETAFEQEPGEILPEEAAFEQELEEAIPEEAAFEQGLEEAAVEEPAPEPEPGEEPIGEDFFEPEKDEIFPEETVFEPEEEELPGIATATLAELYFDQGHMPEAIDTYEKVIEQNPEDETSKTRLEELKAMLVKEEEPVMEAVDRTRQKKEKMISILESWLSGIKDSSKSEVSPT